MACERGLDEEIGPLSALVGDLPTLARADSGQAELAREFVYLDGVVAAAVARLSGLAGAKGVALDTCLERDVALLGVRQLALNLLDNAVKYTPTGGRVQITAAARAGAACLELADTGVGIPPEDLPRVFDRFYRAEAPGGHISPSRRRGRLHRLFAPGPHRRRAGGAQRQRYSHRGPCSRLIPMLERISAQPHEGPAARPAHGQRAAQAEAPRPRGRMSRGRSRRSARA